MKQTFKIEDLSDDPKREVRFVDTAGNEVMTIRGAGKGKIEIEVPDVAAVKVAAPAPKPPKPKPNGAPKEDSYADEPPM